MKPPGPVQLNDGVPRPPLTVAVMVVLFPEQIARFPTETVGAKLNAPTTKSFNVAVIDWDERVSTRKLLKHSVLGKSLLKFVPPSTNVPVGKILNVPCFGV